MKPMATRNPLQGEAWWETALSAIAMLVFLAALFVAWILLEARHEPEERFFTTATGTEICRAQMDWGTQR